MVEKEITGKENDASTIVRNDGGEAAVCVWVCVHACRGYVRAMGSIVQRTIGVKLG